MPQQVLIDTDILIDFALDRSEAVHTLIALEQVFSLSVSVITAMELHAGCRSKKDLKHVDDYSPGMKFSTLTSRFLKKHMSG